MPRKTTTKTRKRRSAGWTEAGRAALRRSVKSQSLHENRLTGSQGSRTRSPASRGAASLYIRPGRSPGSGYGIGSSCGAAALTHRLFHASPLASLEGLDSAPLLRSSDKRGLHTGAAPRPNMKGRRSAAGLPWVPSCLAPGKVGNERAAEACLVDGPSPNDPPINLMPVCCHTGSQAF